MTKYRKQKVQYKTLYVSQILNKIPWSCHPPPQHSPPLPSAPTMQIKFPQKGFGASGHKKNKKTTKRKKFVVTPM